MDLDKVKTVGLIGAMMDVGSIAFSTTDTTVAVPTTLTHVLAGFGVTISGLETCSISAVGAVTAGSVTFNRSDTTSGDSVTYVLIGY